MGRETLAAQEYPLQVRKVLLVTLILNSVVALAKIFYGYVTNSLGMTSDGFHSLFDGVSNVIGLLGIWIASHPPDEDHPYGHKKYETVFTIIIAIMIFATCFQILRKVYFSFIEDHTPIVTGTSFFIMAVTMGVNVFVMRYEARRGKELGSDFLIADALHTKTDILASGAVITGLILVRFGINRADTVVGIIITFFIARIGYKILRDASSVLVDTVCIDTSAVEHVVNGIEGVRGCHSIRTRGQVKAVYLDLHVLVDRKLTTEESHRIADRVENKIKDEFPSVIDIIIHIEPELEQL